MTQTITFLYSVAFSLLVLGACTHPANNLDEKDAKLKAREQKVADLEQELRLKERSLEEREHRLDSLVGDGVRFAVPDPNLEGNWQVLMECIETTCDGSAIGDKKSEQWGIAYNNNQLSVLARSEGRIIRSYIGYTKGDIIQLRAEPKPDPQTEISVSLNPTSSAPGRIEGQRIIDHGNKCKVIYQLTLEKL